MHIRSIHILLFCSLLLSGCFEPEEFPDKPELEFEKFQKLEGSSSAYITVSFTDGDGNVGLEEEDTTGKFSPDSKFHYNLWLEYHERQDGEWVHRELDPPFYYRVPPLEPDGENKALEGDIRVELKPTYFDPTSTYDTIKYSIQLVDRDLQESNVVESEPIITSQ